MSNTSNLTQITYNVQQLNENVAQFSKLIGELGTQRDGKKLRCACVLDFFLCEHQN